MENLLKNIGEKLKALRTNRSLTQQDVALLLNISHSAYAKLERGETDMTVKRLEEIAIIFGTTGIEIMKIGETLSRQSNSNNNNNFSQINSSNSTLTLPINTEEIKEILKKSEMFDLSLQKIVKRLETLEKKGK